MSPSVASLVALALVSSFDGALASQEPGIPDLALAATDGKSYPLRRTVAEARYTVFVFFSAKCPCVAAHDQRLSTLARSYQPRDVQFFLVDSEVGDALERGRGEVQRRNYPFPILADPGARLARALGARFATTSVVVDREWRIRYRGGIDSEKRDPNPNGRFYLQDALTALLAGREPDPAETKSLGCYLRTS